jgi:hypothetical protein
VDLIIALSPDFFSGHPTFCGDRKIIRSHNRRGLIRSHLSPTPSPEGIVLSTTGDPGVIVSDGRPVDASPREKGTPRRRGMH